MHTYCVEREVQKFIAEQIQMRQSAKCGLIDVRLHVFVISLAQQHINISV